MLSLLHTLTLPGLLVLNPGTCFLINHFRDISYQNQATHSLPPPNGHLQAGLRKKRCSILSKLKENFVLVEDTNG